MISYDKEQIKNSITLENIYELLSDWGAEPVYTSTGLIAATICHNEPGNGSKKMYYYQNSSLFYCFTNCGYFDIMQLVIQVAKIQWHKDFDLNDAVRWLAQKFGISGEVVEEQNEGLDDWKYFSEYDKIQDLEFGINELDLKTYDESILDKFNYNIEITPWIKEGISPLVLQEARIGIYLGTDQITIPHFDKNNNFIGLRGRTLCEDEGKKYGKYRPIKINNILYSHPLGLNLYNFNNSKNNIGIFKKAIVVEGEKSALKLRSFFGKEADISVACCGSSISQFQMNELLEAGAEEIIIAFDRQFQSIGDSEFIKLKNNLLRIRDRYKNYAIISFIFDKNMLTGYKDSPVDLGKDIFLELYKERIVL